MWLWIFVSYFVLRGVADEIPQKHTWPCVTVSSLTTRHHYNQKNGAFRLVPIPFRFGKEKQKFIAGNFDTCTKETFNGVWWYKDSEVK